MTLKLSACMEVVSKMGQRDQDALLAYLDDNRQRGVPLEQAQIQAAESVLRDLLREQGGDAQRSTVRTVQVDGVRYPDTDSKGHVLAPMAGGGIQGQINFWRWFRGSKVVDAEGRPLVVYHASTYGDFAAFDKTEQRKGMAGFGFYFTDAESSSIYADHAFEFKMDRSWKGESKKVNIMPVYLAMKNPLEVDNIADVQARFGKADPGAFGVGREVAGLSADAKTAIERAGHDGVIANEYVRRKKDGSLEVVAPDAKGAMKHPVYVVFEPTQIKSSIGNNGQFDPTTGDITQSTAREQGPEKIFGRDLVPLALAAKDALSPRARNAVDSWNVNWDSSALERAFRGDEKLKDLRDEITAAFEPVRAKLRQIYGDSVPAFRGEHDWGANDGPANPDRALLSWSPVERIARSYAQNGKKTITPLTDAQVESAIKQYNDTGFLKLRGYSYLRTKDSPQYYSIYDRSRQYLTDGDDIEQELRGRQSEHHEWNEDATAGGDLYAAEIPVEDIVWIPSGLTGANFHDPEFIAKYNPRKMPAEKIDITRSTARVAQTSDGYKFAEQPDGTWSDGDHVFESLDDLLQNDAELTVNGKLYSPRRANEELEQGRTGGYQARSGARWSDERIDRLVSEYSYFDGRTKAMAAFIQPDVFVDATSGNREQAGLVRAESAPLDREHLAKESQTPFLYVDTTDDANWEIVGHEGRHRMAALSKEGVTEVPVVLIMYKDGVRHAAKWQPAGAKVLLGQTHREIGTGPSASVINLQPLEYDNQQAIKSTFGGEGDVQFSRARGFSFDAEKSPLYKKRDPSTMDIVTPAQADAALQKDATARRILAKGNVVKDGQRVGSRLNINVLKSTGVPVNTVHEGKKGEGYTENKGWWGGEVLTYQPVVTLRNAYLNVSQSAREKIATGEQSKSPMASVDGEYVGTDKHNFDGVEFRFNPKREHLFRDALGRVLRRADEVTISGNSVFARGEIEYYGKDDVPARAGDADTQGKLLEPGDDSGMPLFSTARELTETAPEQFPERIWRLHEKNREAEGYTVEPWNHPMSKAGGPGISSGALKRNSTMSFRRLNEALKEIYPDDEQARLEMMRAMNEESARRESDDAQLSTGRTATGAAWDSPSASKFDDLVYKLQDKHVETKRVVEAIKTVDGAIRDDLNVYLQEELFHGRAAKRTDDFVHMELQPLVEQMARDGLTMADVEEFLHARHAKEANEVIAQRNPGVAALQDGGSGMMTAVAQQYLASLDPAERTKLEAAAARVDAIIARTRQLYVDYQLESQDTIDGWGRTFQHYIPLQREDKDGSPGIGQGFSIKGKETKGRTGSTRKVVDILANIAMARERAITRGEKNRVSQALVGLATANPNPGFWTVNEVPHERVFDPDKGVVVERADPMYKNRENALVAKIMAPDGSVKEHAVLFNEDDERAMRMAAALKNLDAAKLEGILGLSAKVTRYFAAINTQYNPVFGVVNLLRDVQSAILNSGATAIKGDGKKIARDAFRALTGVYSDMRAVRKGGTASSQWSQLWEEFQHVGGQTGYRDMFRTSADRAKAIEKELNPDAWMDSKLGKIFTANGALKMPIDAARKVSSWVFDWLSDYNEAMENGTRLAAYKAGLDRGLSKEQAASIAKNLTVNFNRKGQVAQQAGALYAFFNASAQGSARIFATLFDMEPGKPKTVRLSATGKKIVYGGLLLGSMQALLLAAAGFNDEDPPDFVRERSLILPIGGKKYLTLPMPQGFHIIPNAGRIATEFAMSGFKDPQKRAKDFVGIIADAFNPIGNAGLSIQTLAPTALDPLVALSENRDWTGKPIARTSSNKAIPGHALARDTSTSLARALSEGINALSGGNHYVAGVLSPTPDQIDYLIGQVTGGVGRELSKVEQTGLALARGEELPTHKIPLAGRFFGDAHQQASEGNSFYANAEALNRIETEVKGLQKDGKSAEAREVLKAHPESYLIAMANSAERDLMKLRSEKRDLVDKGAPREKVKAVEESITKVMSRLNRAVEKARGQVD